MPDPTSEGDAALPCAQALVVSAVALMTTWADPCPNCTLDLRQQRALLTRRVASNLLVLMHHPALGTELRRVMVHAHERWEGLRSTRSAPRIPQRPHPARRSPAPAGPCIEGLDDPFAPAHPSGATMNPRLRNALEIIAFTLVVALIWIAVPVQAHEVDCSARLGLDRARCERHQRMAAQCGAIQGEAHFACDRSFLIANPLDCTPLAGDNAARCQAEVSTFRTCAPQAGRDFMRCVRDATKASPLGAP